MIYFSSCYAGYDVTDIFVPNDCEAIVKPGDHVLLEYELLYENGTVGTSLKQPSQLYHVLVDQSDDLPVQASLKGMCKNATRRLVWFDSSIINLDPIYVNDMGTALSNIHQEIYLDMRIIHITEQKDYQIFDSLRMRNISMVLDLIDAHLGVNAVDEWGQTVLMIAVSNQQIDVISSLLNTRRPRVDVNMAKP
eukprot:gene17752-24747_t